MDCNQAGSSVHGIFQEKILEWMATPSSKVSSWPRDGTRVSLSLLHGQVSSLPLAPNRKSYDFYCSCSWRLKSSIPSAKTRPGADCGWDHELLIAKFRLKLKKVGKTTRPFRYDLNQFLYDHTVEVTNRFKGLDLIDRVPEEVWMEDHDIVQEVVFKTIIKKKKCKKAEWLSEEALQIP